jgi:osmotically inducible protein OsmC
MDRKATATWKGDIKAGNGIISTQSLALDDKQYSFKSRFDTGTGTNPEELIAAAHAGCFSMAFANALAEAGFTATQVKTTATVHLDPAAEGGPAVTKIHLVCDSVVPNIDKKKYEEIAVNAKTGCPISKLLKAAEITLEANLIS